MKLRCPICGKEFEVNEAKSMPFCSARCRSIDLNRWLGEGYSLPHEKSDDGEEPMSDEEQ